MGLAYFLNGVPTKVAGAVRIGEFVYAAAAIEAMIPAEQAALGVVEYQPAGPVPAGQRVLGTYLITQGGVVVERYQLEPIPLEERKAALLIAIDAERDRRQQLDLVYDFGEIVAVDDAGNEAPAGQKALQMKFEPDQRNWLGLQSQALAAVFSGQGELVMPMRAEDNFNVQTTALQVLGATAAMVARNAAILFFGGQLKTQVRNAANATVLDAININIGWP
ncbi:hypothetical protein [Phenylobacterium koreense]|uniref:DUF4376 domain-containing protein n=1 Tax=Phenylobacterium koreense TaxID=266125 RepID=A0ABV2EKZ4_9CAUL